MNIVDLFAASQGRIKETVQPVYPNCERLNANCQLEMPTTAARDDGAVGGSACHPQFAIGNSQSAIARLS
jgi:hypothetical protein